MDLGFKDKVAVVTGGASGIGEVTCRLFAQEGAKVALFDINDVQGEKVAREIRETGGECEAIKVNLTLEEDVKRQSILSKKR